MELSAVLERRRAYRALAAASIDEATIAQLAAAASLAPSCFNRQPWRFVFAVDPVVRQRLHDALAPGNEWARRASLFVAVTSRRDLDCVNGEREYFLFDTGMATAMLLLKATELGLVAHPIAGYDEARAREALAIPADFRLITLVVVGRHADEPEGLLTAKQLEMEIARPPRLPMPEIMRIDRF